MAEAAVESRPTSDRFFCHQCTTEITPKLPDFVCPQCDGGFIEQMSDESHTPSPTQTEIDPAAQFAEMWSRAFLESFRNHAVEREDGPSWPRQRDSDEEGGETDDSRRPYQVRFAPRTRISFRRSHPNRSPYLEGQWSQAGPRPGTPQNLTGLVNYFLSRLGGETTTQGVPVGMFQLHGNPGDYAWGVGGLDSIITQLLSQLEGAGAPPAEKDKIDALPKVKISSDQAGKNLQCSICMEDFKVAEEVRKLPCEHHYHSDCITKWLEMHGTCPVCRKDLNGDDAYAKDPDFTGGTGGSGPPSMNSDSSNSSDDYQTSH